LTKVLGAGVPPQDIKLDLSLTVLKPLSLEWAMQAREHLIPMQAAIVRDMDKIGISRAIRDRSYQQKALRDHSGRLFGLKGVSGGVDTPTLTAAEKPFSDLPFPDQVEDDAPVEQVVAALEAKVAGVLVPPIEGPTDGDPAFMLPPPQPVPDSATAYALASALARDMMEELSVKGLREAVEGKHRKNGRSKKATAATTAVAATAGGVQDKVKKARGRPKVRWLWGLRAWYGTVTFSRDKSTVQLGPCSCHTVCVMHLDYCPLLLYGDAGQQEQGQGGRACFPKRLASPSRRDGSRRDGSR
jgi:hypothetical protein